MAANAVRRALALLFNMHGEVKDNPLLFFWRGDDAMILEYKRRDPVVRYDGSVAEFWEYRHNSVADGAMMRRANALFKFRHQLMVSYHFGDVPKKEAMLKWEKCIPKKPVGTDPQQIEKKIEPKIDKNVMPLPLEEDWRATAKPPTRSRESESQTSRQRSPTPKGYVPLPRTASPERGGRYPSPERPAKQDGDICG